MSTNLISELNESSPTLPDLKVRLQVRRSFFRKEWVDVKTYALNRTQLIIKTDEEKNVGDTLTLSLTLPQPFESIVIEQLDVTVGEKRKMCSNFFYLADTLSGNGSDATVLRRIERIEDILSKKIALNQRRSSPALDSRK